MWLLWCEILTTKIDQDHGRHVTMAAVEDTDLVVQKEEDIVAEVIHVLILTVGQDLHDDRIHVVHPLTIGDDNSFVT